MKVKIHTGLYTEQSFITFGKKHRGECVKDVLEEDPQYLIWCHENKSLNFILEPKLYKKAKIKKDLQEDENRFNYGTYIEETEGHWGGFF